MDVGKKRWCISRVDKKTSWRYHYGLVNGQMSGRSRLKLFPVPMQSPHCSERQLALRKGCGEKRMAGGGDTETRQQKNEERDIISDIFLKYLNATLETLV